MSIYRSILIYLILFHSAEEVTITHEKKEKKVKKSMIISN